MPIEYVTQIKEQEELAERIRHDGLVESRRILAEAKDDAAAIIRNAREESEDNYRKNMERAEKATDDDHEHIIHQAKTECRLIKERAEKMMGEASGLIMYWVIDEWQS